MNKSVLQPWVENLTMMQQTVLLTAIRGPDGIGKYSPVKYLLRWFRRCVLLSAMDGKVIPNPYDHNGGSFTGPSVYNIENDQWELSMDNAVSDYLRQLDELPHHFQLHLMHAIEILGYKHPDQRIGTWWAGVYLRLVSDLHLFPESEKDMDFRLGDNRQQWLTRNDSATVE